MIHRFDENYRITQDCKVDALICSSAKKVQVRYPHCHVDILFSQLEEHRCCIFESHRRFKMKSPSSFRIVMTVCVIGILGLLGIACLDEIVKSGILPGGRGNTTLIDNEKVRIIILIAYSIFVCECLFILALYMLFPRDPRWSFSVIIFAVYCYISFIFLLLFEVAWCMYIGIERLTVWRFVGIYLGLLIGDILYVFWIGLFAYFLNFLTPL